ncbi:MAG: PTS sugar transporter subunit IIA, partial [Candidatus Cloacimonadota bacterium]|nr:PTS sugar transporter subunit IIA [Candidatus Cloacimonadota bacterium]
LQQGIRWEKNNKPVRAVFLLIGTLDMREHHLKALMAVAQLIQNKDFFTKWNQAKGADDLKSLVRLLPRSRSGKSNQ